MLLTCNSANYHNRANWNSLNGNLSTVGLNGQSSHYGTFDQTGNINELLDTISGSYPIIRGGSFKNFETFLTKSWFSIQAADMKIDNIGFRVAKSASSIDSDNYVLVGNPSNSGDTSNDDYGRVNYNYQIKKYPVTNGEYVVFLNAIAKTANGLGLWNKDMEEPNRRGGIVRTLISGLYVYTTNPNMQNKPVNYINWFSAARYINWLSNGQPIGVTDSTTTEDGVYTILNGAIEGTNKPTTNNKNSYWLPSEDEWYKAAYYDPNKNGSGPGYWTYATISDAIPDAVVVNSIGTAINTFGNPDICISPTPTPTVTPSLTNTPTVTPTITLSVSATPTYTPTVTETPTNTPTNTTTRTVTPTITVTRSLTKTPTVTRTVTPTNSVSLSPTRTPTLTRTVTPTVTPTSSITLTPSKSLCSQHKIGELLYQSSLYLNDELTVLHKGFLLKGSVSSDVSVVYEPPNMSPTPTSTPTPTNTPTLSG